MKSIKKLEDKKLIEKSNSPWSSGLVLVQKKDLSWRLCVDYRKLNDKTIKDAYPIPRIEDNIDALSGAKWMSVLDLSMAYHQVPMNPADKEKTAFSTPREKLYRIKISVNLPWDYVYNNSSDNSDSLNNIDQQWETQHSQIISTIDENENEDLDSEEEEDRNT
ncbi:Hypothetical predicted protein [Mytilus galloprovincialis]|uniref:Reverse transcriptase domain-containing protein n=1 Tax=Mytilus galloprovincialis TaxID=29158 RepID=A0A8B6E3Y8_MYTGA|nr:Hypothetical predicted protein [Mytilus galloprovincialis]